MNNFYSTFARKHKTCSKALSNILDDFTKNERTQSLARFAKENQFKFVKREPFGEQATYLRNFRIFGRKGVKRFLGITHIPPAEGLMAEIRFYDYLVTKDLETKSTSIIEVHFPGFDCDLFRIKPRSSFVKFFSPNFSKSINSKFRKKFSIEGNFEVSDQIIDMLLAYPKITVEGFDNTFLFYHRNKSIEVLDILEYVRFAEDFLLGMGSLESEDFV